MLLVIIFISSLCAIEVTSIDPNVPHEPTRIEDRIGNVETEIASMKREMIEVEDDKEWCQRRHEGQCSI